MEARENKRTLEKRQQQGCLRDEKKEKAITTDGLGFILSTVGLAEKKKSKKIKLALFARRICYK